MKRRFMKSTAAFICAAMLASASAVQAAELTVFATAAHVDSFKELVPQFEKTSGHKLTVNFRTSPVTMKGIEAGEPFDVVVAIKGPVDGTAEKGFFASGDRPVVSVVGLGAAVKAGAPKPDIATADAFKQTLLNAKAVSIVPESVNGKHFLAVFEKLGIGEQMKAKIVAAKTPAEVPAALVKGDADLALFIVNGLRAPGVDYVGPVPAEFDQKLVFVTAISAKAKEPQAANDFVKYLQSPAAVAIMKANGLDTQ
ncbi:MAG: extracellular solute-binding protein [Xanthobacteraceae bacterium]|nr:extracellular solute-binding protein [Xanthobacteraceae bacterium]